MLRSDPLERWVKLAAVLLTVAALAAQGALAGLLAGMLTGGV